MNVIFLLLQIAVVLHILNNILLYKTEVYYVSLFIGLEVRRMQRTRIAWEDRCDSKVMEFPRLIVVGNIDYVRILNFIIILNRVL